MSATLVLMPRMSEKTYALSQSENVFVFDVPKDANKIQIKDAVEKQFKVSVDDVRVMILKGKRKSSVRRRTRGIIGKRADFKKAYVTIKKGESLPIFAAIEEAEEKEKKAQDKADKAVKKAQKGAK